VKVAVVGAGGIGSVFGGRLAASGHTVWLIHRRRDVVETLRRDGLRLQGPDGEQQIVVHSALNTDKLVPVDLVLIATKATDTRAAAEASRPLIGPDTFVLTLQNGLGNLEIIAELLGAERTLLGMTYVGAAVMGPAHVRLTAPGQTFIGEPNRFVSERCELIARVFSDAGLPTQSTDHLWEMVWGKLVINAALNATCALTGATGEAALHSESARMLLGLVANETAAVAAALGIALPYPDAATRVRQHCRDVGPSKPSMLQDMERARPTEVDAINGAVVREGKRLGVATPYNEALLLLVKGREQVSAMGSA
jgi:2-dehydropantoate 2-reductase